VVFVAGRLVLVVAGPLVAVVFAGDLVLGVVEALLFGVVTLVVLGPFEVVETAGAPFFAVVCTVGLDVGLPVEFLSAAPKDSSAAGA